MVRTNVDYDPSTLTPNAKANARLFDLHCRHELPLM
jgi:hypothetical protein